MSTWALSRAPLTWSFILCGGSHSTATQLRVIPSCGPSSLQNASVTRIDSSGDVLLGRRLAWATSCLGDVLLLGDDSSWRWHISAITDYVYCRTPLLHTATMDAEETHGGAENNSHYQRGNEPKDYDTLRQPSIRREFCTWKWEHVRAQLSWFSMKVKLNMFFAIRLQCACWMGDMHGI